MYVFMVENKSTTERSGKSVAEGGSFFVPTRSQQGSLLQEVKNMPCAPNEAMSPIFFWLHCQQKA